MSFANIARRNVLAGGTSIILFTTILKSLQRIARRGVNAARERATNCCALASAPDSLAQIQLLCVTILAKPISSQRLAELRDCAGVIKGVGGLVYGEARAKARMALHILAQGIAHASFSRGEHSRKNCSPQTLRRNYPAAGADDSTSPRARR
jgi:hypothetical protein